MSLLIQIQKVKVHKKLRLLIAIETPTHHPSPNARNGLRWDWMKYQTIRLIENLCFPEEHSLQPQ